MKAVYVVLILAAISILGCNKEADTIAPLDGDYIGTFERDSISAEVALQFENGTYSGTSDRVKFPAICNGTYEVSGNTINFVNQCPWTADFDWSLILNDRWNISSNDDILILTNPIGDRYQLIKQKSGE